MNRLIARNQSAQNTASSRPTLGKLMRKASKITCVFLDIGGVRLTDGWDHLARNRWRRTSNCNGLPACLLVAVQHYDGPGTDSVARISHMKARHSGCNVVWSGKRSVHGAEPALMCSPGHGRKFKLQRLPICVDRNVTHPCACEVVHGQREAV